MQNQQNQFSNFGDNVRFEPAEIHLPQSESELLDLLNKNRGRRFRVIGSGHAWSQLIETPDILIQMFDISGVRLVTEGGQTYVWVGAGCRIASLVENLNQHGLTLPSLGLIQAQRIAGATATGTHGSGKHSLSHYIQAVRIASFPEGAETAETRLIDDGPELQAARCSLGAMGIIVEVKLPVIPQYMVEEWIEEHPQVEKLLECEQDTPLQQTFLFPHRWTWFVQRRRVANQSHRSSFAWLYRIYWFLAMDLSLHLVIKLFTSVLRSRRLTRFLFRRLVPLAVPIRKHIVDRSDRHLTMEHDLFRHLELEAFVPRRHLAAASTFVRTVFQVADSKRFRPSREFLQQVDALKMRDELFALAGTYTHHYPICFRLIKGDDTLISPAAGPDDWYAISLITYTRPRDNFYRTVTFIAKALTKLHQGRIHWGKWFPLDQSHVQHQYPELAQFIEVVQKNDPHGMFANDFVKDKLGLQQ